MAEEFLKRIPESINLQPFHNLISFSFRTVRRQNRNIKLISQSSRKLINKRRICIVLPSRERRGNNQKFRFHLPPYISFFFRYSCSSTRHASALERSFIFYLLHLFYSRLGYRYPLFFGLPQLHRRILC